MLELEMLPAEHGDCLWLSWGDPDDPRHLVIDGGPVDGEVQAALRHKIDERVVAANRRLELVVVTHIDADHIGGVLDLVEDGMPCDVEDVWFNGFKHLPSDVLGVRQAERLTAAIDGKLPWNERFGGGRVAVPEDPNVPLLTVDLPDDLRLTVLGPSVDRLRDLAPKWKDECEKAGIVPGVGPAPQEEEPPPDVLGDERPDPEALAAKRFRPDGSEANGASIMLLAEHDEKSLLLTGDALAADVIAGLDRLDAERGARARIDACKLPHHGSKANVTIDMAERLGTRRHLVSSSGKQFHHPNPEALARILVAGRTDPVEFYFNYRTPESGVWDDRRLKRRFDYETIYPSGDAPGIALTL